MIKIKKNSVRLVIDIQQQDFSQIRSIIILYLRGKS